MATQNISSASRRAAPRTRIWPRAAAALGVALLVAGCAGGAKRPSGASAAQPPTLQRAEPAARPGGEVAPGGVAQVALLTPLSAPDANAQALAKSLANAAELALGDMRAQVARLRIYDTKGTEAGAAEAARRALQDGADVFIGPVFARSVRAVRPIAEQAGVTTLAFSNDTSVAGGSVFLLGFLVGDEIERVTSYAAQRGLTRMAALAPQNRLGDFGVSAFQESASQNGVEVVTVERYPLNFEGVEAAARRYAEIHKQQVEPITAVLIADRGQSLQSMAAFLNFFDVSPSETKFFGPGVWRSESTTKEVSLRGGWLAAPDPGVVAQFDQRYAGAYASAPHPLASLGYDAMAAVGAMASDARARRDTTPFSPEDVANPGGYVGVNGVFRFRRDGLNQRALAVLEVRQDGFVVVDPASPSFVGN